MCDHPRGVFAFLGQIKMQFKIHRELFTKNGREWETFYTSLNEKFSLLESHGQEMVPGEGKAIPEDGKQPLVSQRD